MGRAAHTADPIPASRNHSPLPLASTPPYNVIGDSPTLGLPPSPPAEHMEELIALCLLGKVWGEYVLLLVIINKTKQDWKFIRGQVNFIDLGNNWISIIFANSEDKEMVWRERPWHVNGLNFMLSYWLPFFDPYSACIDSVDQWVRVLRLSWEFWEYATLVCLNLWGK